MTSPSSPRGDRLDRRRLREALAASAPFVGDVHLGPAAVDAGECDRCGVLPRVVATCGPQPWRHLCRDCLLEVGTEAFCEGHRDDALANLGRARELPDDWDTITRLAWVASGEVRPDRSWLAHVAATSPRKQLTKALPPPTAR